MLIPEKWKTTFPGFTTCEDIADYLSHAITGTPERKEQFRAFLYDIICLADGETYSQSIQEELMTDGLYPSPLHMEMMAQAPGHTSESIEMGDARIAFRFHKNGPNTLRVSFLTDGEAYNDENHSSFRTVNGLKGYVRSRITNGKLDPARNLNYTRDPVKAKQRILMPETAYPENWGGPPIVMELTWNQLEEKLPWLEPCSYVIKLIGKI